MAKRKENATNNRPKRQTFTAIRKTLSDIGRNFSEGSDKVADIVLDNSEEGKNAKGKKIKDGTVSVFKNILFAFKANLAPLTLKDVLCDTTYELGKFSKITKNTCVELFDELME